jgi:hypothetical protein
VSLHSTPPTFSWSLYWGIGTYFGDAASQNINGDKMGEVRVRPNAIAARAYSKAGPLQFHNDRIDMLSLFCVRPALSGGANVFVSLLKVYETIAEEHPEILAALERGFYVHRGGEQAEGEGPVTEHRVPVFSIAQNLRSGLVSANAILTLQKQFFADTLTPDDIRALEILQAIIHRPGMGLRVGLPVHFVLKVYFSWCSAEWNSGDSGGMILCPMDGTPDHAELAPAVSRTNPDAPDVERVRDK